MRIATTTADAEEIRSAAHRLTGSVRPAMHGSYEHLFHDAEAGDFLLRFDEHPELGSVLTPASSSERSA